VVIRNMKIAKVLAAYGDGVTIQLSTNVWVDHCDFSGDETVGKDTYDGLVDLSHAADFVTISNTYFHNHVCTVCFIVHAFYTLLTNTANSPKALW
jgi:pectate lyase